MRSRCIAEDISEAGHVQMNHINTCWVILPRSCVPYALSGALASTGMMRWGNCLLTSVPSDGKAKSKGSRLSVCMLKMKLCQ